MTPAGDFDDRLPEVLAHSPVRVVFGPRVVGAELGRLAAAEGAARVLLVTDAGLVAAGHVARAVACLHSAGIDVEVFDGSAENPTTEHVASGVAVARRHRPDWIVGLGGGSAVDCAKGVNLIHTNGGQIADYWGEDKVREPLLPMILIPATAGTGSEAQSFALITDPVTRRKMVCGDRRPPSEGGLRPRIAILDPDLTLTQPPAVAAAAGIDAVSHAVESSASTRRGDVSRELSRQAWRRLSNAFERAIANPSDLTARCDMLLGAHLAGAAIENAMLGAAHACANPLTARFGVVHGVAVGLMLPHVIRFNATATNPDAHPDNNPYADLDADAARLARRIEQMLDAARLPRRLTELGVIEAALPDLARLAAGQWTARFNPRPVGESELLDIYRAALG